ncbi:MAG: hypothetical protein SF069_18260 [Phycisphaerae bacterium]|nr:hypothetical protein [Phycisphaerae bacterium]
MKRFHVIAAGLSLAFAASAFAQLSTSPSVTTIRENPSNVTGTTTVQQSTAGVLSIVTNNAQQQIVITVGPVAGEVDISGVSVPAGTPLTGITAIELTTGRAQDYVEFVFLTPQAPNVTLNTGLGISDVKFIYLIDATPETASSNVTVTGNSANDLVSFTVESRAAAFAANWNVSGGAGNNEVVANINSPEASESMSISLNGSATTGQDKLELFAIHSAALTNISLGGSLGSNSDVATVLVDSLNPADTTLAFNLNMGAGADASNIEFITRGGTASASGSLLGGDGIDALTFKLEQDGAVNVTIDGGSGNDLIDYALKGLVTGTPTLLGGIGNDELKLVVDGPQLATPFFDGGPGFDIAIGFGTFVNVEQIN